MSVQVNFNNVAKKIMFEQKTIIEETLIEEFKLEYRSNKNASDISHSIRKSLKNGMNKTEFELELLELYLSQVFKTNERPSKTDNAKRVLELMDSCEDGDSRYAEFVNQVSEETGASKKQLEKELDHWI